jgi:hypothetical protein
LFLSCRFDIWNEQVLEINEYHIQTRPKEFPPSHQQAQLLKGSKAEIGGRLFPHGRAQRRLKRRGKRKIETKGKLKCCRVKRRNRICDRRKNYSQE